MRGKKDCHCGMRRKKHRTQIIQMQCKNFWKSGGKNETESATDAAVSTTETAGHCAIKESVHYEHWELYVWKRKIVKEKK